MKNPMNCVVIILSILGLLGWVGAGEDPDQFVWLDDLEEARLLARDTRQPLLIVFRCEP